MTEQAYTYRNLILWQKAPDLALAIVKLAGKLPNDRVAPTLARQVVRSASSVSANIAEGHGRYSLGAHRNHLSIAKGSVCETDSWVDLLCRAGYLEAEAEQRLHANCEELMRMLTAKILDLERRERAGGKSIREEAEIYAADAAGLKERA